jgi:copper homeostasis protein
MNLLLEVCAGSLTSALAAQTGGAHRVELCDNLSEGGTTPSPGIILQAVKMLKIPVFVLIRPRAGDFLYSEPEFDAMKDDILFCKEHGAKGAVFGILHADGSVDKERNAELVRLARPMQVTFHRAFDMSRNPIRAMEDIISLGIDRILTSGQAANALAGADLTAELIKRAVGRIIIMPGGGINEDNVSGLLQITGATEIHASLRSPIQSKMQLRNANTSMGKPGRDEYNWMETDPKRVRKIIEKLK